jgi:hypothetical protein
VVVEAIDLSMREVLGRHRLHARRPVRSSAHRLALRAQVEQPGEGRQHPLSRVVGGGCFFRAEMTDNDSAVGPCGSAMIPQDSGR